MYGICRGKCFPKSDTRKNYNDEKGILNYTTLTQLPNIPCETRNWQSKERSSSQGKRLDTMEVCKCECDRERIRRIAEARRKKMIQKLKVEYNINVEDLNNKIVDNMIMKIELMEKQKKLWEKEKIKCRLNFINKLAQEAKFKRKGLRALPDIRKKHKFELPAAQSYSLEEIPGSAEEEFSALPSLYADLTDDEAPPTEDRMSKEKIVASHENKSDKEELEYDIQPNSDKSLSSATVSDTDIQKNFKIPSKQHRRNMSKSAEFEETHLKCYPSSIKFENCESRKTYVVKYRITNIGCEIIHCRYVGIEMKGHEKKSIPLQAEISDNALLRPGLSFTSKITMFSTEEIPELNLFLVYETRRKKNPNIHRYFRIPLIAIPARSVVHVSPTVIRFPPISWCVATDQVQSKHLTKSIKIRNAGAKACSCCIKKEIWKPPTTEEDESENVEMDSEESLTQSSSTYSYGNQDATETPDVENDKSQREASGFPGASDNVQDLIIELLDNVFEIFRFSRKYFIPLPPFSTVKVDVGFHPEYKGYHHETMLVHFEGAQNCTEKKIELIGDIKRIPLHIEPSTIDLKICILNSGVYEGQFKIYNDSNGSLPVLLRVPGSMKEHALVFPRNPVVQPWSYQTCSVRFFPGITLTKDASRYYKEDTKMLEFPVFIQPSGSKSCKSDHVKLHVFALLTDYALELKPKEINFNFVTTLETVRTEISLTNHSLAVHEYGFLDLPIGVRIEPNNGFGFILPKETIPLHVLYSPVVDALQERDYKFRIHVTTIAELGSFKKSLQTSEDTFYKINWDEERLFNLDEVPLAPAVSKVNSISKTEEENFCQESHMDSAEELIILENKHSRFGDYSRHGTESQASFAFENADGFNFENSMERSTANEKETFDIFNIKAQDEFSKIPVESHRMNVIVCRAFIINPKCELSSSVILLPATPLSSICTTRFHLTGLKSNTTAICKCSQMDKIRKGESIEMKDQQFEGCFHFISKSSLVTIEPCTGVLTAGQSTPIDIIFHPELTENELQFLKAKTMQEESQPKEVSSEIKKSKMKLSKPLKNQKEEKEAENISLANCDTNKQVCQTLPEHMIDPFHLVINVDCFIRTLSYPDLTERMEAHALVLIAPVTRPSFVYLGNDREINFGKVVLGDRRKAILEIQNIALKKISPRISALNPHGPFYCTTGSKMDKIDPEHIWKQPLTFAPMEEKGKETEYFEIRHGRTILSLTVNGESISPKYAFSPDFALCLLESAEESESETEFSIESSCEAEMRLHFVIDSVKASSNFGDDSLVKEGNGNHGFNSSKKQEKGNGKTNKDAKKRTKFETEITPETAFQLENEFEPIAEPPPGLFSIIGPDAGEELVLDPFRRISMKIKFSPQAMYKTTANGDNHPPHAYGAYAARYKLILFNKILLRELTVVGKVHSKK